MKKQELEEKLKEKKTIGDFYFDEEKQCFFGNVDIEIDAKLIAKDTYELCSSYFYDGYECPVYQEGEPPPIFKGNEEQVKAEIIASFNSSPELFMDYPIIYQNIRVKLIMDSLDNPEL